MRSTRPKPLHLLCGRPMLLYVLDVAREARRRSRGRRGRPRRRSGHEEGARAGSSALRIDFVEQLVPARHRRRGDRRHDRVPRRRPRRRRRARAARRHTPAACETVARAGRGSTARPARRPRCSPPGSPIRPATAGSAGDRDDNVARVVEHGDATLERARRSTRSTRRSTASAASLLAPALRRLSPEQRPGRVLPDRRRRGAARRRLPRRLAR